MASFHLAQDSNKQTKGDDQLGLSSSSPCVEQCMDGSIMHELQSTQLEITHSMSLKKDNLTNPKVTFSKRLKGLFKKAYELSILCDVEVAVIVFSTSDELFEFSSSSMAKIVKQYADLQPRNTNQICHMSERCDGGHAVNLSFKELQNSKAHLESIMNKIQARKHELLEMQMQEVINKGNSLWTENNLQERKVEKVLQASDENATKEPPNGKKKRRLTPN